MKSRYRKENYCPYCNYINDGAMSAEINDKDAHPKIGDLSICFNCTELSSFDENMILQKQDVTLLTLKEARYIHKIQIALQQKKK